MHTYVTFQILNGSHLSNLKSLVFTGTAFIQIRLLSWQMSLEVLDLLKFYLRRHGGEVELKYIITYYIIT